MALVWQTDVYCGAKTMNTELAIVIPVYHEGESIGPTLDAVADLIHTPHTIYIVYDMDEDNTLPVAARYMQQGHPIKPLKNRCGRGALNAIKTGLHHTSHPWTLVVMADLSDDLAKVDTMLDMARLQSCDIVCGSRYMRGGRQIGGPLLKKTLSRLAGVSLHGFTGIPTHDITNSFKLYSRRVLDTVTIESDGGFELGMEIVIKSWLAGFRIGEVPATWLDRTAGQSRFRLLHWLPKYLRWYGYAIRQAHQRIQPWELSESTIIPPNTTTQVNTNHDILHDTSQYGDCNRCTNAQ